MAVASLTQMGTLEISRRHLYLKQCCSVKYLLSQGLSQVSSAAHACLVTKTVQCHRPKAPVGRTSILTLWVPSSAEQALLACTDAKTHQKPMFTLPLPGKSCNYCILHCSWQHWTWPIFSFFDIFGFSQRHNHTLSHHARITPFIHTLFWRQMPSNRECCSVHCCGRCLALCCASHWWGQWGTALSHAASGKGDMNVMDLQAPPPTG